MIMRSLFPSLRVAGLIALAMAQACRSGVPSVRGRTFDLLMAFPSAKIGVAGETAGKPPSDYVHIQILTCGGLSRSGIYVHPPGNASFSMRLPPGAHLHTAVGIDDHVAESSDGALFIVDVTANGLTKTYDLRFDWSPESQGFKISGIEEKSGPTENGASSQTVVTISPALDEGLGLDQAPPECGGTNSTPSLLPLIGCLENPRSNDKVSGIQTIQGWALDEEGIPRIELLVDGVYVSDVPYGGTRRDLREAYPTYPNADQSGFALIMNYSTLSPGNHIIQLIRIVCWGNLTWMILATMAIALLGTITSHWIYYVQVNPATQAVIIWNSTLLMMMVIRLLWPTLL